MSNYEKEIRCKNAWCVRFEDWCVDDFKNGKVPARMFTKYE